MKYEILDKEGKVINTIVADPAFIAREYPGSRMVEEAQAKAVEPEAEEIDLKTLTNEDFQRIVLEKLGMKVKK